MPFILDASVTLSWQLASQPDALADAALDRLAADEAVVPAIWWFEVRNVLLVGERHGRLSPEQTAEFLENLRKLPIHIDPLPDEARLLAFARANRLSVYDAAYLELAARLGRPLATLDRALASAARSLGVALVTAEA